MFGSENESVRLFDPASRIDYAKFKNYFAGTDCELESLNVWTQIRSFIKGSIEAIKKQSPLSREEFLDTTVIGSRRCRLTTEQRDVAYTAYEKYEKYRKSRGLWDDCDRMAALVIKIAQDRHSRELVARRRVYVDEIQDYTQAEIALFFLICDCGGLFFAGDPAQSVVEGVEFRFEEVRSVAYHLYENDPRYIPKKPLTVTRNFRSHAGILNIAAEVSFTLNEGSCVLIAECHSLPFTDSINPGFGQAVCWISLQRERAPQGRRVVPWTSSDYLSGHEPGLTVGFDYQNSRSRLALHARCLRPRAQSYCGTWYSGVEYS